MFHEYFLNVSLLLLGLFHTNWKSKCSELIYIFWKENMVGWGEDEDMFLFFKKSKCVLCSHLRMPATTYPK